LREGTRAQALRSARTCYDHLAGRVGVAAMDSLLEQGFLESDHVEDGLPSGDRLSSPGRAIRYGLTEEGALFLEKFGVDLDALPPRRPAIRYCIDWSEQRPHLAGAVGAALTSRIFGLGWIRRAERSRAVHVTDEGRAGFARVFGIDVGHGPAA
jgi:hypothetical protein